MLTRLGAMIPIQRPRHVFGTFHGPLPPAFTATKSTRDGPGLSSSFQSLDSGDKLSLIKRRLKSLTIAEEIIASAFAARLYQCAKESGLYRLPC